MEVTVKSPDTTRTCPNNKEGCNNEHVHTVINVPPNALTEISTLNLFITQVPFKLMNSDNVISF